MLSDLQKRDLEVLWHPCSQMQDYEKFPPLEISSAQGSILQLANGKPLIDAISSWWCKSFGHRHPFIMQSIQEQMNHFDHVILANTTNENIVQLSEKLCNLSTNLNKVFYAGDGSTALEIALKMSFHAQQRSGHTKRTRFLGLENGYHGETLLTLGVSDLGLYKQPYDQLWTEKLFLNPLPYISDPEDPKFLDCDTWPEIEKQLLPLADELAAIVVEPMLQGAGGMLIYSAGLLKKLRAFCDQHQIYLIADEILTGFGRTGKMLACEWADIEADFICLSKGLTGGSLPLSAMLTQNSIYDLFYGPYEDHIAFMHSNTHSGNALAVAAALGVFKIFETQDVLGKSNQLGQYMKTQLESIQQQTGQLKNIRHIGSMIAADLVLEPEQEKERIGYKIYREATQRGALLRPLGNTIYWLPPINTEKEVIDELKDITLDSMQAVLS